jgi:hypothetical protein
MPPVELHVTIALFLQCLNQNLVVKLFNFLVDRKLLHTHSLLSHFSKGLKVFSNEKQTIKPQKFAPQIGIFGFVHVEHICILCTTHNSMK